MHHIYTFKRCDNSGKSTIDLTLTRGLKNVKVKTKEIETIKTEHQAIEINIEGEDETIISSPKFRTKNANWAEWKESLKQHNINKTISNNHDKTFRKEVEKEITTILENTETSPSNIYFTEDDIKYAIKISNKNSAPGPDRITTELIEHGGETLTKSIILLMQASCSIGYIPEQCKRENIHKKTDKINYHKENSYRPLSLLSTLGKIYERIIL